MRRNSTEQVTALVRLCFNAVEQTVLSSKFYSMDKEPITSTVKVLKLLEIELNNNPLKINERVLRAMHDIGMSSYKDFENTPLEAALINLIEALSDFVPGYDSLEPLRESFGKGFPL